METAGFWKKKQKHLRPFKPRSQAGPLACPLRSTGQPWCKVWRNRFYLSVGAAVKSHFKGLGYREGWRITAVCALSIRMPFLENEVYIAVPSLVTCPKPHSYWVAGLRLGIKSTCLQSPPTATEPTTDAASLVIRGSVGGHFCSRNRLCRDFSV